jgi:hypothetical protein
MRSPRSLALQRLASLKLEPEVPAISPIGTGTLVRSGNLSGILTAGHVVQNLPNGAVGLVRFPTTEPKLQNFRIEMLYTDRVVLWDGIDEHAPDLAFLLLPQRDAASLEAFGSVFYNLDRERNYCAKDAKNAMGEGVCNFRSRCRVDGRC